jgi:hypothetical protein
LVDHPALVPPAREQVIGLAAEVLGRLPAEEVPASLRAIARFAPAKRHRLGGAAIAAALEADDVFRGKVAEVVVGAAPELAEAVRTGGPTAAADPLDVALLAFLDRPDGWPEVLSRANERWAAQRGTSVSDDELARLRAEVAELRGTVRSEPARLREALAAAHTEQESELAGLRRTVRERTRELRAAERDRDAARAAVGDAEVERDAAAAAHEAELRRLRGRLAEAERAAENARRVSRTERDLDDARLWLLVDTLVQAANGVRRELSLPAPSLRPADTVQAGAASAGGGRATDPAAFDQLLALPHVHLIVDGYNVTKSGYGDLPLEQQRTRLVGALAALAGQSGAEITIAFDGAKKPPSQPVTPRGVRVLFSAADEIADDLIRRLVAGEPAGRPVVVVTSDQQVVTDVTRARAWTVPSAVLLARLG